MTLSSSVVLVVLVYQGVRQGAVSHRVLVHTILLEIRHHVCKPCLRCRFCSLLLDLVHLLKVLFGDRIQLRAESLLGLKRASLRLGDLVDLEPAAHGGVHHDLARCLNLLQAVESYIIEVARAVEVPLLVAHDLFKEVVSTSFTLLPL